MFNAMKQPYQVFDFVETKNEYNETILEKKPYKVCDIFISYNSYQNSNSNDIRLQNVTYTGITEDRTLKKGMMIEDRWSIEYINPAGNECILYLKEVVDNAS